MERKKDIRNKDSKGVFHGYQQWYSGNGTLWLRTMAKNDLPIGYSEGHMEKLTRFHIR